eukprot:3110247-Rhodomonas_salina.1
MVHDGGRDSGQGRAPMFFGQYHDADKSAIVVGSELRPADKLPCPGHTERVGIKLMLLLLMPSVLHGSGFKPAWPASDAPGRSDSDPDGSRSRTEGPAELPLTESSPAQPGSEPATEWKLGVLRIEFQ